MAEGSRYDGSIEEVVLAFEDALMAFAKRLHEVTEWDGDAEALVADFGVLAAAWGRARWTIRSANTSREVLPRTAEAVIANREGQEPSGDGSGL